MSRSRMSTSTSHEPRFRMRSFAAWNTAARSVGLWALLVLVLNAVAASQNTATSSSHAGITDREAAGCLTDCTPRFGIVSAFGNEADLLVAKTVDRREYRINGNVFTTGVLEGNPTVIVLTGQSIENASMLTQLLIDHFRVHHLLLSGIAGGLSDANHIGDVVIPDKWSLPLEGYWNGSSEVPAPCGKAGDLTCVGEKLASVTSAPNSDFQVQTPAGPASTGLFMRDTFVMTAANSPQGEFKFDYAVDPEMLRSRVSSSRNSIAVVRRIDLYAFPRSRGWLVGGRGVTLSTFLANSNYREYLSQELAAVSVDMETSAFAHVAYANSIPFLAFRALSDQAGGTDYKDVGAFFGSGLAETNESRVTLAFLQAWSKAHPNHIATTRPLENLHSTHLNNICARRTGSECRRHQLVHWELIVLITAECEVVAHSAVDERDDCHQNIAVDDGYLDNTDRSDEHRRTTRIRKRRDKNLPTTRQKERSKKQRKQTETQHRQPRAGGKYPKLDRSPYFMSTAGLACSGMVLPTVTAEHS